MSRSLLAAILAVVLGASLPAHAQVNAETFAAQARNTGFGFGLTAGLSLAAGNVEYLEVKGDTALQYLTAFDDAPNDQLWVKDRVIVSALPRPRRSHRLGSMSALPLTQPWPVGGAERRRPATAG